MMMSLLQTFCFFPTCAYAIWTCLALSGSIADLHLHTCKTERLCFSMPSHCSTDCAYQRCKVEPTQCTAMHCRDREETHEAAEDTGNTNDVPLHSKQNKWWNFSGTIAAWRTYLRQDVLPPAVALALLYLTVMSFGPLMTAYLNWRGMNEAKLSLFRGFGATAGVACTFCFPWLHDKLGEPCTSV